MGAWGSGNFDNDMALDWVLSLIKDDTLNTVRAALDAVTTEEDYLDVDLGAEALAAAEVVAALTGKPGDYLPEEVADWVASHRTLAAAPLVDQARRAAKLVIAGEDSELWELWAETDELDNWTAVVDELHQRLGAA
jgi:hypothetical protein